MTNQACRESLDLTVLQRVLYAHVHELRRVVLLCESEQLRDAVHSELLRDGVLAQRLQPFQQVLIRRA